MPRHPRYSDDLLTRILPTMLQQGLSVVQIAAKLYMSQNNVRRLLTKFALPTPTRYAQTNAQKEVIRLHHAANKRTITWAHRRLDMVSFVASGASTKDIAAHYNTSPFNVQHWLRRFSIPSPAPRSKAALRRLQTLQAAYRAHPECYPLPHPSPEPLPAHAIDISTGLCDNTHSGKAMAKVLPINASIVLPDGCQP